MSMITQLPENIEKHINGAHYSMDSVGQSGSQVICFDDFVLKISDRDEESNNEFLMLRWLENKLPVPRIIEFEQTDGKNYLLMSKADGEMTCSQNLINEPEKLIQLLCDGLHMLWNVDISDCSSDYSLDEKLILAEHRVNNNLCTTEDAEPQTYGKDGFKNPAELLLWLKENKPDEDLVLSHGDYCLPNIFVKNHRVSGFIDLGRCGKADKYQDIALCYRSLQHNFDGKFGTVPIEHDCKEFFEILGIRPDWDKIRYYILLDELF